MNLLIDRDALYAHKELNNTELLYALAIDEGRDIDALAEERGDSKRTKSRIVKALRDKKVLAPKTVQKAVNNSSKGAAEQFSQTRPPGDVYQLGEDEGVPDLKVFETGQFMHKHDRFRVFCDIWGADPTDKELRQAWRALEFENKGSDPDKIPHMAHLMHQILKAAQLQRRWEVSEEVGPIPAAEWIRTRQFDSPIYAAAAGEPPSQGMSDEELQVEYGELMTEMDEHGLDYVAPVPGESHLAIHRRIKARHKQAMRNKKLGLDM